MRRLRPGARLAAGFTGAREARPGNQYLPPRITTLEVVPAEVRLPDPGGHCQRWVARIFSGDSAPWGGTRAPTRCSAPRALPSGVPRPARAYALQPRARPIPVPARPLRDVGGFGFLSCPSTSHPAHPSPPALTELKILSPGQGMGYTGQGKRKYDKTTKSQSSAVKDTGMTTLP